MADRFVVGAESAYGTTATTWRKLPLTADGHMTKREPLTFRAIGDTGGAPALNARRIVDKGAEGQLQVHGISSGLGILFRAIGSTFTSGVHSGGTLAYDQVTTFDTANTPSGRSLTVVKYVDRTDGTTDGTTDSYRFLGGQPTELAITQSVDELVQFNFTMDYQKGEREASTPARTVVVPDWDVVYSWADAEITLTNLDDDSDETECLKSFELTIPRALDTEDYCLKRGTAKHRPSRNGLPEPTGTLNWKYQHPRYYDAFVAGTAFSLVANWEGTDPIEDTTVPSLTIEIPAIVFTGEDPQLAVDESTMQNLPFAVMSNGTDPAVTITMVTPDSVY